MSKEIALKIKQTCQELGWNYEVRGSILTITKRITHETFVQDRKSTRLNSSHTDISRMPSSA